MLRNIQINSDVVTDVKWIRNETISKYRSALTRDYYPLMDL